MHQNSLSLGELLAKALGSLVDMTPEQRRELYARQGRSYATAEAARPRPNYKIEGGVKVYASYADYVAD